MTAANGPGSFETEGQVRELPAVRVVYEAFDADPGAGSMAPHSERMLRESCAAAGVVLGAFDRRVVSWLAGWGPETCAVIGGLIIRAHVAGRCGQAAGTQPRGADLAGNYGLSAGKVATGLAALVDATNVICEQAAWCWECEMAPSALCGVHEEALARAEDFDQLAALLRGQRVTGPALRGRLNSPGRCPVWCARQGRHEVHIKNVGSAGGVHVRLVCTQGLAAPRRLCEPHVVLRRTQALGGGEVADVWLSAGEAGQLAVILAHLGQGELSGMVAGAAVAAAAEVGA